MNRRKLFTCISATTLGALAGCTGVLTDENKDSAGGTPDTATETPEPNPHVSWSEEWLRGTDYRVSMTVQLDSADQLLVNLGTLGGDTVTTITTSGEHTVAGPNTEFGSIEMGQILYLVRPVESEFEELDDRNELVDSFPVGTQVQPTYPIHLRGVHGSTDPNLENSGTLSRDYIHDTDTGPAALTLEIPEILYKYYQNRPRVRNYGAYVSDTYDDQYIQGIVDQFQSYGERRGLNDLEVINHMMQFVQSLEYTSDKVSAGYNEYPKYPIETLVDREGDCEDSCILLSSMLEQFGYGSVLLIFPDQQHMALGIAGERSIDGTSFEYNGHHYYYTETTAEGWRIGEFPPGMTKTRPEFGPVNDSAVLVLSYAVNTPSSGGASVEVSMKNVGDGTGPGQTRVTIQNQSGETVASKQSNPVQLAPKEEHTTTLKLLPPDDQTLRIRIDGLIDDSVQSTIQSDWQEPVMDPSSN